MYMKGNHRIKIRISILLILAILAAQVGIKELSNETAAAADTAVESFRDEDGVFGYVRLNDNRKNKKESKGTDIRTVYATPTPSSAPYQDIEVDRLGQAMSDQLNAAFGNSTATKAVLQQVTTDELATLNSNLNSSGSGNWHFTDISSKVTFQLPRSAFPSRVYDSSGVLYYLEQAISRYPALCTLFTLADVTINDANVTMLVYSPIPTDKMKSVTSSYASALNEIMKVIINNPNMSVTDKLLYLHDEVVAITEYSTGRSGVYALDHTPVASLLYNLAVCQSYSAAFNHLIRMAGITGYVIDSDTHAWNAVLIDNKWYYIDTTWDDTRSIGQTKDYIKHNYILVGSSADSGFSVAHSMTSEYLAHFSGMASSLGNAYDSYFPKSNNITSQMGYLNGYFYYADNNVIKRWDRNKNIDTFTGIPSAGSRRVAISDRLIYVSGSDGMYQSDAALTGLHKVDNTPFTGLYEAANVLYVSTGGSFYIYRDSSSPVAPTAPAPNQSLSPFVTPYPLNPVSSNIPGSGTPTPTRNGIPTVPPLPTASVIPTVPGIQPTPVGTIIPFFSPTPGTTQQPGVTSDPDQSGSSAFTAPASTYIKKIKNNKKRAVFIKWKKVKGSSRYQVKYSTSPSFATKQLRDSMTNSVTIANLFINKTYYFKVRAVKIKRVDGVLQYKYSAWSTKRKKLITR